MARRVSSTRFVGRAEPVALFDDVLADLGPDVGAGPPVTGRGAMVLIAGEAGVGKSRLVDELTGRARRAGALVLRGWCVEHGGDVMPLAPVIDLLRAVEEQVALLGDGAIAGPAVDILRRLVPELGPDGTVPAADPLPVVALSDGVLRALIGLGECRPVVVVLEDIHWSDASTRQLLDFLAPRLVRHRIVLMATYRSDELHRRHPLRPFLVSLRRAIRPEQIDLSPFTRAELADLVAGITGTTPAQQTIAELYDRTGGNAFFAEELLAGESSGRPMAALRDAVLSRTEGLDDVATTVLQATAAAGAEVSPSVLAESCGLSAEGVELAMEALITSGLCVRDADCLRFRHELAREIIEEEILSSDRAGMHAALASAMQSRTPRRQGEIARHWMLAGQQSAALEASMAAGRAAVAVAADAEAFTQFERALELWDLVPDAAVHARCGHSDLLLDAADAAGRARLFSQALALGRRGVAEAAGGGPSAAGRACLRLLPWAWFSTDHDDLKMFIEGARAVTEDDPRSPDAALALAWQALIDVASDGFNPTDVEAGQRTAERAVALATATGAVQARVHAEITLATCSCICGDAGGLVKIRTALDEAMANGFAAEAGRAYDSLAVYLAAFGRWDDVIDLEPEALEYCAAAGIYRVHGVMVELRVIRSLQRTGRWHAVEQRVERLRAEFGTLKVEHLTLADSWGLILVRRGRLDGVAELVDDAFARLGDHRTVIGPITVTAIELAAARGELLPIPDRVEWALDRILHRFPSDAAAVIAAGIAALADLAPTAKPVAGQTDPEAHRRLADSWLDRVRSAEPPQGPWILLAEAEGARLRGEHSELRWTAAVDAWRELNAPYETAYARWRLAEALLKGGNRTAVTARSAARALLIDARRSSISLEAAPLTGQIDALAARAHVSLDVPRAPADPDGAAAQDRFGLTSREQEVLALVSAGYSNGQIGQALFISRKTASVHVSNILRKLGVASRLEAATLSTTPRI